MQRTKAPFRADEVGSLLRPPRIKEARAKLEKGEISADDLRKVEDMEIEKVVHKQASIGLKLATDGEFRRSWWHLDFLWGLDGVERHVMESGVNFAGVTTRAEGLKVTGKRGIQIWIPRWPVTFGYPRTARCSARMPTGSTCC